MRRRFPFEAKNFRIASERGFGLLEVIIAASLMTIIGLGITQIMVNAQGVQTNTQFRGDSTILDNEMRTMLGYQDNCTKNFVGKSANAGSTYPITTISAIVTPAMTAAGVLPITFTTVPPKNIYGQNGSVILTSMTLTNFAIGEVQTAHMQLVSHMTSIRGGVGTKDIVRVIDLNANLDPAGNIATCASTSAMTDGIWTVETDLNDIYFAPTPNAALGDAKVGIGTSAPTASLSVIGTGQNTFSLNTSGPLEGSILVGDRGSSPQNGGALVFSAYNDSWKFAAIKGNVTNGGGNTQGNISFETRQNAGDATLTEAMRISSNGNVGINTGGLDPVSGLDISSGSGNGLNNGTLHIAGNNSGINFNGPQGAYHTWNIISGTGTTDLVNNRGLGAGGFTIRNTSMGGTLAAPFFSVTGVGATPEVTAQLDVGINNAAGDLHMQMLTDSGNAVLRTTSSIATNTPPLLIDSPGQFQIFPGGSYAGHAGTVPRPPAIHIDAGGWIGLGTVAPKAALDVYKGEIRPGSSGVGCSGTNEGAVRYDNVAHAMTYCGLNTVTGIYSWTAMGGGSVSGYQVVQKDCGTSYQCIVACPGATMPLGGGGFCNDTNTNFITYSYPSGQSWIVGSAEAYVAGTGWVYGPQCGDLRGYAVCANTSP